MAGMAEKLDTLMRERDGGNDQIVGMFDEKIKKVYEEIETKAPTETVNAFISTRPSMVRSTLLWNQTSKLCRHLFTNS